MAMLAEEKQRVKWSLNPCGKQWSDDQNKLGQRLLEKMGWSAGQGLGVNNQGPTDFVKVKKKDNVAGLGFKENTWLEKRSEYHELLSQLACSEESVGGPLDASSSLENRSKNSKTRIHYHKFARGKDVCRYSKKDLASIIGPEKVQNSVDTTSADYSGNQINKGSSTEYFNGKNIAKRDQESELKINEESSDEGQASSLDKKHKKSKKLIEDSTQDQNYEVRKSHKKSKKEKHGEEEVADCQSYHDKDLNIEKLPKKKNKSLKNRAEIKSFEHIKELKFVNNSSNSCTDSESILKTSKIAKNNKVDNSVEPEIDNSVESQFKEQREKRKKIPKRKKGKLQINNDLEGIANESKNYLEIIENVNAFECENNCYDSNTISKRDAKMKTKVNKLKTQVPITSVENSISSCTEGFEDNLTYSSSKSNIQKLENNCTPYINFPSQNKVKEENKVSKKKKKIKQDSDCIEQLENVENENVIKRVPKKRKSVGIDTTIYNPENNGIKRMKSKEESIEISTHEELNSVLSSELDKEPSTAKLYQKESKRRKKQKDQSPLSTEANSDCKVPKKHSNINKENKFDSEIESDHNNEDITKVSSGCLTVFGRKTRLNNLSITLKPAECDKFVTEDFMAFNESNIVPSTKSCENLRNSRVSSCQRICVEPNDEDSNISMNVANYEYRLLTSKMKLLNIPTGDVKIIIKKNVPLPKKLHKKLKLLYKSKYYKSLIPPEELASVEASIEEFAAKLQPRIDVIKGLVEIENQTVKLAKECGVAADENNTQVEQENLTPEKKETLKVMKKKFKLLSKVGKETINVASSSNEEFTDGKRTKMAWPNSKYSKINGQVSSKGVFKEVSAPLGSLQTRIEERLRVLAEQMKQLTESRKLLTDKNSCFSNEKKPTCSRWGEGSQKGRMATSQASNSIRYNEGPGPTCTRSIRGHGIQRSWAKGSAALRSQAGGRGLHTVLKGRISKNNFDAKQYAMKCKVNNKLPEITFKGVDLKVISGYAANSSEPTAIEPSSQQTNSSS